MYALMYKRLTRYFSNCVVFIYLPLLSRLNYINLPSLVLKKVSLKFYGCLQCLHVHNFVMKDTYDLLCNRKLKILNFEQIPIGSYYLDIKIANLNCQTMWALHLR